ncbi:MAG TPA: response regulator transcription factor [Candidatus Manganitrophaceae bacterium]
MNKIRILIADDHRVVREGLGAILKTKSYMDVVGEATNGLEAVQKARTLKPDVILMDMSMPQMNGVEATRLIKKENPQIGVVALTMHEDDAIIFDLVRAGVTGYLLKDSDSSEVVKAIRSIYKGESLIHPAIIRKILGEFSRGPEKKSQKEPSGGADRLSAREIDVLKRVAEGKTNKEIANDLALSEKTIKNHVRNIFHKLKVYDRTQAAIKGIKKGIINIDEKIDEKRF